MRHFIAAIIFIFIFSSCKDNLQNSLTVYKIAEEGLLRSNKNISLATDLVYNAIEQKTQDYKTLEVAAKWQPKAYEIKRLSDSIINYIRELKEELMAEAGGNGPDNKDWENNLTVTGHVFESHGRGKELFERLTFYRRDILSVDSYLRNEFENKTNVFAEGFNYKLKDTTEFTKTYFNNIPLIGAFVMLSKFENNVKICENEFVRFCYNQIGYLDGESMFEKYTFVVAQKSSYLKAGEELEIYAGIGAFSNKSKPSFTIYGKNVPVDENAIAIYKLKTPLKAGKYYLPVKVEFTKQNGARDTMEKTISYTVVE